MELETPIQSPPWCGRWISWETLRRSPCRELTAGNPTNALEVNNQGMIAGQAYVADEYVHAVVWTTNSGPESYVVHDLGTLGEEFDFSEANGVSEPDANGNVWVVGDSQFAGDPDVWHAVLWQVDSQGNLPTDSDGNVLPPTDLGPGWAFDVKVIGNSVFVAGSSIGQPTGQAVIWEADLDGNVVEHIHPGTTSFVAYEANALNNDGDAVGYGSNFVLEQYYGFLYDNADGSITDLGSLGNRGSRAYGINDSDVVVGHYENAERPYLLQYKSYAFVWEDGTMHNLLDLVSDRNFLWLKHAYDVNNNGEIVGIGACR